MEVLCQKFHGECINPHECNQKCSKNYPKNAKKDIHLTQILIIKSMSLVVNLSNHFCQPCCDGACTFGGVLWRDELHLPQSILYSKQPKSQFKK
jgi:hypothetical protein